MRAAGWRPDNYASLHWALALLLIAAYIYSRSGFQMKISRDAAVEIYTGQQIVAGVAPYVSIFRIHTPLAPFAAAGGIWAARAFGFDDILGARLMFFGTAAGSVAALFLLGETLFGAREEVRQKIRDWLRARYRVTTVGDWTLYVK
jgi:hypothetical protein